MGPSSIPEAGQEYFNTSSPRNDVSNEPTELTSQQMISGLIDMANKMGDIANQMESQNVSDITNFKFNRIQKKFTSLKQALSENPAFQVC